MGSINQNTEIARSAKGKASIQVDKNSLRICLPRHLYQGKQKYLSIGLADTPENRSRAEAKLITIQRDIDYNEFDATLEKYRTVAKINTSYLAPGNLDVNSLTKCQVSQAFNIL